nr:hypothetical transcript [Hymenolepis microstoma]
MISQLRGVTRRTIWFHHLVPILPTAIVTQLAELTSMTLDNDPYDRLKQAVINRLLVSHEKRLDQHFAQVELELASWRVELLQIIPMETFVEFIVPHLHQLRMHPVQPLNTDSLLETTWINWRKRHHDPALHHVSIDGVPPHLGDGRARRDTMIQSATTTEFSVTRPGDVNPVVSMQGTPHAASREKSTQGSKGDDRAWLSPKLPPQCGRQEFKNTIPGRHRFRNVKKPIIGVDFLSRFRLLVNLRNHVIRDNVTSLQVVSYTWTRNSIGLNSLLPAGNPFSNILSEFSSIFLPQTTILDLKNKPVACTPINYASFSLQTVNELPLCTWSRRKTVTGDLVEIIGPSTELPWERRVDSNNRVYYVNHSTRTTTWHPPSANLLDNVTRWRQWYEIRSGQTNTDKTLLENLITSHLTVESVHDVVDVKTRT